MFVDRPLDCIKLLHDLVYSVGRSDPFKLIDNRTFTNNESAEHELKGVHHGGHWSPTECSARQRIAIIIPFRDRQAHLEMLLKVLHPMLQRQLVDYTIFVIEQVLRPRISWSCVTGVVVL